MPSDIRQKIIDEFISMVEEGGFSKVRITALIARLGINRNTFYYHFDGKLDIVLDILLDDLSPRLVQEFEPWELVGLDGQEYAAAPRRPYYARSEIGAHALDDGRFVKIRVSCVLARKAYYRRIITPNEADIMRMFFNLYLPAYENDVRLVLGGRYLPEETIGLLAKMGVHSLLAVVEHVLQLPDGSEPVDDDLNPFWNFYQESLSDAIRKHPVNRAARR